MSTNETVLIIVTAIAALLLAGTLAGVAYRTRSLKHGLFGGSIHDEVKAEALQTARSAARARQHASSEDQTE